MIDVALIRPREDGVHYTLLENRNNRFVHTESGVNSSWRMKDIPIEESETIVPKKYRKIFQVMKKHYRGRDIINDLKNRVADGIVNRFLLVNKAECVGCIKKISEGHGGHIQEDKIEDKPLISILTGMLHEDLSGVNNLSTKKLHIGDYDIFREFVKQGLIKI